LPQFDGLRVVWLEAFVQAAESTKRTAAAEDMGITQGAVTKHIQKLEDWLHMCLIVDGSSPVELLPDGEAFLPVAKEVLRLLGDARRSLPEP